MKFTSTHALPAEMFYLWTPITKCLNGKGKYAKFKLFIYL